MKCVAARPVLGCADLERSRAVWCDIFGFAVAVERNGFLLLRAGPEAVVALRPEALPRPSRVTLEVRDLDAAWARCEHSGLDIERPLRVHDSGRRDFVVRDPDGHQLEIAEPPSHGGHIGWVDLTVDDATTSCDFWAHVAGVDAVEAVSMRDYSDFVLATDGRPVAGVCHRRGENAGIPPVWMVYFTVDDLEASLTAVIERGGAILERRSVMAVVRGPEGAVAALYQG